MKWIKASERLPKVMPEDETLDRFIVDDRNEDGYGKVWLMSYHDLKNLAHYQDVKWLDEGEHREQGEEGKSVLPPCPLSNEELIKRSREWVSKLCKDCNSWTLTVPVDMEKDPDILFSELCNRLESPHQSEEAEAVEFAEWIVDNMFERRYAMWYSERSCYLGKSYTTKELYTLFKSKK